MKKATVMLSLLLILFAVGCAHNVKLEMNGLPVPDNVVQASILSTNMKLSMCFVRHYEVPEGDEVLETFTYLPFQKNDPITIDPTGTTSLTLNIRVRNPTKASYQMWLESVHRDYGTARMVRKYEPVYTGDLSQKEMKVPLPMEPGVAVLARIFIYDADNHIAYMSPIADYVVGRTAEGRSVFESKAK